jgi:hypothetical protein
MANEDFLNDDIDAGDADEIFDPDFTEETGVSTIY